MCPEIYDMTKEWETATPQIYISTTIDRLVEENEDLIFVDLDGAKRGSILYQSRLRHPDRVWESGIAEQNMIGIAAGAALNGKKAIVMSYGPFLSTRSIEQIHLDVAYNEAPVCIVVTSCGVSAGEGATHHSLMDIAFIRCIPGIELYSPCDSRQVVEILENYIENPRPMYIRCGKANEPLIYKDQAMRFLPGGAMLVKEGENATIVATGTCVKYALEASSILHDEGIEVGVMDVYCLKPFDVDAIKNLARKTPNLVSIEDHGGCGGLGSILSETIVDEHLEVSLTKFAFPDSFLINGDAAQLYEYYRINTTALVDKCKEICSHT